MKNATFYKASFFTLLLVLVFMIKGCYNDDNPVDNNTNNSTGTGYINGTVYKADGNTLFGATVSVGNNICICDEKGGFFLKNVSAGSKVLVNFEMDNYTYTQKVVTVIANRTVTLDASLIQVGAKQNINAATGGSVQFNGAIVNFPPNSLVDSKGNSFIGTALVKATYFDPSIDAFYGCFPGEFKGVRRDNSETPFESFGFISVEIFNGSEKLQLASGKQADITIPICAKLQGNAPQSIPLWYYDEEKGSWIEEGTAIKSGNNYVGTVSHFTMWNADNPTETSYLTGRVVDSNGDPISLSRVFSIGADYAAAYVITTLDDGTFNLPVKASAQVNVHAKYYNYSSNSAYYQTPSAGQTSNIGDITVPVDSMNIVTVIGRIVDNTGAPLDFVYVKLWDSNYVDSQYNPPSHVPDDLTATNTEGYFKMFGKTNMSYYVEVMAYYFDTTTYKTRFHLTTGDDYVVIDMGDLQIDVGGVWVLCTVVDADDNPMANISYSSSEGRYPNIFDNSKDGVTSTDGKIAIWARPNITMWLKLYNGTDTKLIDAETGDMGETVDLGNVTFP
ncbi:carboxypeptidase-like regulatory domain-containing protein [Bacteroidota bacterium]